LTSIPDKPGISYDAAMSYTFILRPHGDMSWRKAPTEELARAMADELRSADVSFHAFGPGGYSDEHRPHDGEDDDFDDEDGDA